VSACLIEIADKIVFHHVIFFVLIIIDIMVYVQYSDKRAKF
jgi:hypothetical protein